MFALEEKLHDSPLGCAIFLTICLTATPWVTAQPNRTLLISNLKPDLGLCIHEPVALIDAVNDRSIQNIHESREIQPENLAFIHAHTSEEDISPMMPKLELHLASKIAGSAQAKLEVDYPRGNGARPKRGTESDRVLIPSDGSFRNIDDDVWKIHEDPDFLVELEENGFFGGNATLTYRLTNSSKIHTIEFRIGGENPIDEYCKAYIQSYPEASPGGRLDFMYAIARHESKAKNRDNVYYNQFLQLGTHPEDAGFPTWNNDGGRNPGGYGVFQVTGTAEDTKADIDRDELWNWQSNIDGAFEIMTHQFKDALATRFFNKIKSRSPKAEQLLEQSPPPTISIGGKTFSARKAVWITAYNGWGGLLKNRFVFSENKPAGIGRGKRWNWNPPVKPSGKTYLQLIAEELQH